MSGSDGCLIGCLWFLFWLCLFAVLSISVIAGILLAIVLL